MKKIVCPRCGAVNLEKFVTFPHCAGCACVLPVGREPARESVWRRPLRAGWWMSLVGLALAGVLALSFSTPQSQEPRQLMIYAQMPRQVRLGEVLVCRLGLESVRRDGRDGGEMKQVAWQLARSVERDWRVVGISPAPDAQEMRVGKPVWIYNSWPEEARWTIRLQPRARGRRAIAIVANASDHYPLQWRGTITVR